MLEIRKTRTTTRNPKGNGQAERFMKTLTRMIRAYLKTEQTDWDMNLGCLAAAYRSTPNESTRLTPNLLMLGREVRLPAEIVFGSGTSSRETVSTYGEYVTKLKNKMQTAHRICRENMDCKAKRQKEAYNTKQSFTKYEKGDIVWYLQNTRKDDKMPKTKKCHIRDPFLLTAKMNNQNYRVLFNKNGKSEVVHHDKLNKKCAFRHTNDPPGSQRK